VTERNPILRRAPLHVACLFTKYLICKAATALCCEGLLREGVCPLVFCFYSYAAPCWRQREAPGAGRP